MLTHQKTKPFVCIEQGCGKSYCDYRSLRRHYEVQHGLCVLKEAPLDEEALGDSPHAHEAAGLRPLVPPEARSPGSLLPSRDLLRCIVSSIVHQKMPSPGPALADSEGRPTACPCPPPAGPPCTLAGTPTAPEGPDESRSLRKEPTDARVAENGGPNLTEADPVPVQLPTALEAWPEGSPLPACLPLFRGQAGPSGAQPAGHSFQWLRSLPGCPKGKGNSLFVVHKPPAGLARDGPQAGPAPSTDVPEPLPSSESGLEEALPFPPSLLKLPGETAGDPRYAGGDDDSWTAKKSKFESEALAWPSPGEPSTLPTDATPLFRQLFLKSQEPLVSPEQMQVLQMLAKSQRLFPHAPGTAGPWPQQSPLLPPAAVAADALHSGAGNPEPEGSPARRRKGPAALPREASPGSSRRDAKGGTKVASGPLPLGASSLDAPGNPDLSSLAKQLRSSKGTLDLGDIFPTTGPRQTPLSGDEPPGAQLSGKQAQTENGVTSGTVKSEKGPACSRSGYRLLPGNPRAQRFSGFRKEKVKMDLCCAASPSQVAMASFSSAGPPADAPRDSKSKLTIFNRIQVPARAPVGPCGCSDPSALLSSRFSGCSEPRGQVMEVKVQGRHPDPQTQSCRPGRLLFPALCSACPLCVSHLCFLLDPLLFFGRPLCGGWRFTLSRDDRPATCLHSESFPPFSPQLLLPWCIFICWCSKSHVVLSQGQRGGPLL